MPTGYTADIKKGISFERFILDCARNFGATVTMRDDPKDMEIPIFKPTDYHTKELTKLNKRLSQLKKMSQSQAKKESLVEYNKKIKYNREGIAEAIDLKNKYELMLINVKEWEPPTDKHKGLKDFMVKQITESIDFDCGYSYYEKKVELLTGENWIHKELKKVLKDIDYHTKQNEEEIERVDGRNLWIKQLKESL